MIYNLVYGAAVVLNMFSYLSFRIRQQLYWAVLAGLFVFVTFRWDVGCDWGGYLNHSINYGPMPVDEALLRWEPGYWLMVVAFNRLGWDYPAINIFASLSFFGGLHAIARRQPDRLLFIALAFPILMTGIAMSATRQALAIGFVCLAYNAFADKKFYRYVGWILVATQFHKSAIAFLMFAPFLLQMGRRYKILAALAALPVAVWLLESDVARSYTDVYVGGHFDAAGGPARTVVVALTGVAFLLFLRQRWSQYSPEDFELINTFVPALIAVFPLTYISSVMGDRFGYYLMVLAFIVQAKAYVIVDRKLALAAFLAPILVQAISLFGWTHYSSIFATCYLPYRMWW